MFRMHLEIITWLESQMEEYFWILNSFLPYLLCFAEDILDSTAS